jgi:hypothetical protein
MITPSFTSRVRLNSPSRLMLAGVLIRASPPSLSTLMTMRELLSAPSTGGGALLRVMTAM